MINGSRCAVLSGSKVRLLQFDEYNNDQTKITLRRTDTAHGQKRLLELGTSSIISLSRVYPTQDGVTPGMPRSVPQLALIRRSCPRIKLAVEWAGLPIPTMNSLLLGGCSGGFVLQQHHLCRKHEHDGNLRSYFETARLFFTSWVRL